MALGNDMPKISVLINTLNEEKNLPYALRSVKPWAGEIVVVDMYSEDRTVEIARDYGAKVFFYDRMGFVEPARAYAIEQATGDWMLILDADELVPPPLAHRLRSIALEDKADVVLIPRLNYLLGAPLVASGWGANQDKHARFFKRGMLETSSRIHAFLTPKPQARALELAYRPGEAVIHFNYVDVEQFIEKLNRYTNIEAKQALERSKAASPAGVILKVILEFLNRYLRRGGYKDGWRGFYLAGLMAMYRWATFAKLAELKAVGERGQVENLYRLEAERILAQYTNGAE
ncbi:glycosyltransferase family 2 protein [Allomeiothermus silvanus]|uniref:glycosyltransferase family 2 protein n=1 Tax=Allomeiothermus silvanus TaxID=52022 RepID=UPI0023F56C7A|nr:glycosyltransferase family 2 protein [Allomeiothermus silvanus]